MHSNTSAVRLNDIDSGADAGYRAYSSLAVLGLALGLVSPAAFVSPVLYVIPVLGVVASAWGLARIRAAAPELVGKTVAQLGLVLAIVCGVGAATRDGTARYVLQRDAWHFGNAFFEYLRRGEPEKAYLLTVDQVFRPPLDDESKLWRDLELQPSHQQGLRAFVLVPDVRAVLELGDKAVVRPYQVLRSMRTKTPDGRASQVLNLLYAVTYDEDGRKKSFFVTMKVERSKGTTVGLPHEWKLLQNQVGVDPN